jgi:hypothetical protein
MNTEFKNVIVYGNVVDGIKLVGPFDDAEEACDYAEDCRTIRDAGWVIASIEEPGDRSKEDDDDES